MRLRLFQPGCQPGCQQCFTPLTHVYQTFDDKNTILQIKTGQILLRGLVKIILFERSIPTTFFTGARVCTTTQQSRNNGVRFVGRMQGRKFQQGRSSSVAGVWCLFGRPGLAWHVLLVLGRCQTPFWNVKECVQVEFAEFDQPKKGCLFSVDGLKKTMDLLSGHGSLLDG